jgi:hypothetical protein
VANINLSPFDLGKWATQRDSIAKLEYYNPIAGRLDRKAHNASSQEPRTSF